MLNLSGQIPVAVRHTEHGPRLLWEKGEASFTTDFDRFRPVRLGLKDDKQSLAVTWADFSDLSMTDHFYKHTTDHAAILPSVAGRFQTDFDTLQLLAAQPGLLPFAGVIFHMARTGSTLIHRLFSCIGRVHSLSEITVLDKCLSMTERWPVAERRGAIADVVASYRRARRPNEQFFITKMTDAIASVKMPLFLDALPATPWIFVYRDPIEVMVSILRRPTGSIENWYNNRTLSARRLGMPRLGSPSLWPEEFLAFTLKRFCDNAVQSAKATPKGRFLAVHYPRLPDAIWETIAPHFGIELSGHDIDMMRAEAKYSAKERTATEFRPDSAAKQQEATPFMRKVARELVGPAIDELRALPQA